MDTVNWSDWSGEESHQPESNNEWNESDPGLIRTAEIREEDLDSDDIVNFSEDDGEDSLSERNPFILDEAEESDAEDDSEPIRKKRKK